MLDTILPLGEVALMRAVVAQALADAMPGIRTHRAPAMTTSRRREMDEARRWLLSGGKAFDLVCSCALFDPDVVAQEARKLIAAFDAGKALPTNGLTALIHFRHGHGRRQAARPSPARGSSASASHPLHGSFLATTYARMPSAGLF